MEYDHIITEIRAGMCLRPKSDADYAHDNACKRAIRIVQYYKDGEGLFQENPPNQSLDLTAESNGKSA